MKIKSFIVIIFATLVCHAQFEEDAKANLSPAEAAKVIRLQAQAKSADTAVDLVAMGDPELKKQMYNISDKLMPWLIETTHGDEAQMRALVENAKTDPQAFLKRLPSDIQDDVLRISHQIEVKKGGPRAIP